MTGQEEGFDEAFEFIQSRIHPGADVQLLENNGERVFLAANTRTKNPDVLYLVHVDVVPTENPEQFKMKVDGDLAYGRGASDMKFSIPVGYGLLNHLIEAKSDLSFALAITTDEERGGFNAAKYLTDEYQMRPAVAIVPDGGRDLSIINKSKGVCQLRIDSIGQPAHSSTPWDGKNAAEPVVRLLSELLDRYGQNNTQKGWNTTMNIGYLLGGEANQRERNVVNRVLPETSVGLDFRIPETVTPSAIENEVRAIAETLPGQLSITVAATGEPTYVDPDSPVFKLYRQSLEDHYQRDIAVEGAYGSSDARHVNKYGIPFLMSKPESWDSHGDEERVSISSTMIFYHALIEFLNSYEQSQR